MSLVWEHYPAGGGELLVALAYADHAHDDGTGIRPSVSYTAKKTRQGIRTVQMHLAKMRETEWLLTVKYAEGGRGRATEYRINPAWIANPADFAPFFRNRKRVQSKAKKGAKNSTKGCKAFAPQPLRTIKEPTTTENVLNEQVVVDLDNLDWPRFLLDSNVHVSALHILQECPKTERQNVLYEIAGLASRGAVRSPIGLLRKLVELAKQGQFTPSAALEYQKKLESEAKTMQSRTEERKRLQACTSSQKKEAAKSHITELRKKVNI